MNLSQLSNFMSVTPDKLYKATKAVEYAVKVYGEDYVAIDEYISSTLIGECLEYAQSLLENTKVADYMGVAVYTDGKTFSAPTLAIYNVESKPVIKQKIQAKVGSRNQRENDAQAMKKEELKQEEVGMLPEEDYDRMKDRRMERGGVDGNNRYPSNSTGSSKPHDPKKSAETNKKALDMVRASITAKYGKGAIIGAKNESLDPVGKEDSDIDNDGIKNDKNDKYISKRRKAIGKAIAVRKEERELEEAVLGRYKQDKGGGKTLRPASERTQTQTQAKSEPEGPKITKLKSKGPRKGEATASQVQGWRGSDRTNTNRRGQSAPQAKALAKEELEIEEALDKDFASMRKRGGRSAPPEERSAGGERSRNNKDYWADVQGANRDRGKGNKSAKRVAALKEDLYDIILSHLLDEGYADTEQAAEAIMVNMSEDWRESISEALRDLLNPSKGVAARAQNQSPFAKSTATQKPLPSVTSPFQKPGRGAGNAENRSSKGDSGKLTTYGAGGGKAAETSGKSYNQVVKQGASNLENKKTPNPGPNFGR